MEFRKSIAAHKKAYTHIHIYICANIGMYGNLLRRTPLNTKFMKIIYKDSPFGQICVKPTQCTPTDNRRKLISDKHVYYNNIHTVQCV